MARVNRRIARGEQRNDRRLRPLEMERCGSSILPRGRQRGRFRAPDQATLPPPDPGVHLDGKEIMRSNNGTTGVVLRGTESLLTHPWREMDSNHRSPAEFGNFDVSRTG